MTRITITSLLVLMSCAGYASAQKAADTTVRRQIRRDATQFVAEQTKRYKSEYQLNELDVHFVDVTHDKLLDAVVVIKYTFPGSFRKEVWVYERVGKKYVKKATRYIGQLGWDPTYGGYVDNALTFDVAVHVDGDKPCCSTGKGYERYSYIDHKIELINKGMIDSETQRADSARK